MGRVKGYKHSKETIKKLSESHKGKKHSEETKRKIGKVHVGNKYSLGLKRSDETKRRMSLSETRCFNEVCIRRRHKKIELVYGKPKFCEICKRTDKKMYGWSNKNHKYNLKKEEWQRLCVSCHLKYDMKFNGRKLFGKIIIN